MLALPNSKTRRTASSKRSSSSWLDSPLAAALASSSLGPSRKPWTYSASPCAFQNCGDGGDLFFGDEGRVDALHAAGAGGKVEHVALAEEGFGAVAVDDGARIDLGGQSEADAGGDVGLDEAGDDIDRGALRGEDEMDADGAGHLREAGDGLLDVGAVEHHQVGQLVDDDDDVGQRLLVGVVEEVVGVVVEELVELVDVADVVGGEQLEAALHLADGVAQGVGGQLGVGDDGGEEVGDALVHAQLDALGIDQDHADLFGRGLEEHAHDHGVDGDGLAGAGGTRDEDVRHGGEVGGDDAAVDVLAEGDGELGFGSARRTRTRLRRAARWSRGRGWAPGCRRWICRPCAR